MNGPQVILLMHLVRHHTKIQRHIKSHGAPINLLQVIIMMFLTQARKKINRARIKEVGEHPNRPSPI